MQFSQWSLTALLEEALLMPSILSSVIEFLSASKVTSKDRSHPKLLHLLQHDHTLTVLRTSWVCAKRLHGDKCKPCVPRQTPHTTYM